MSYQFRGYTMRTDIQEALARFANQRVPVGDFLTCVLENDLMGAMGRADDDNLRNLPAICAYVYNDMPSPCHGSPAKVRAWLGIKEPAQELDFDGEAIAWALAKLRAFGVLNNNMDNALMADRLEAMLHAQPLATEE